MTGSGANRKLPMYAGGLDVPLLDQPYNYPQQQLTLGQALLQNPSYPSCAQLSTMRLGQAWSMSSDPMGMGQVGSMSMSPNPMGMGQAMMEGQLRNMPPNPMSMGQAGSISMPPNPMGMGQALLHNPSYPSNAHQPNMMQGQLQSLSPDQLAMQNEELIIHSPVYDFFPGQINNRQQLHDPNLARPMDVMSGCTPPPHRQAYGSQGHMYITPQEQLYDCTPHGQAYGSQGQMYITPQEQMYGCTPHGQAYGSLLPPQGYGQPRRGHVYGALPLGQSQVVPDANEQQAGVGGVQQHAGYGGVQQHAGVGEVQQQAGFREVQQQAGFGGVHQQPLIPGMQSYIQQSGEGVPQRQMGPAGPEKKGFCGFCRGKDAGRDTVTSTDQNIALIIGPNVAMQDPHSRGQGGPQNIQALADTSMAGAHIGYMQDPHSRGQGGPQNMQAPGSPTQGGGVPGAAPHTGSTTPGAAPSGVDAMSQQSLNGQQGPMSPHNSNRLQGPMSQQAVGQQQNANAQQYQGQAPQVEPTKTAKCCPPKPLPPDQASDINSRLLSPSKTGVTGNPSAPPLMSTSQPGSPSRMAEGPFSPTSPVGVPNGGVLPAPPEVQLLLPPVPTFTAQAGPPPVVSTYGPYLKFGSYSQARSTYTASVLFVAYQTRRTRRPTLTFRDTLGTKNETLLTAEHLDHFMGFNFWRFELRIECGVPERSIEYWIKHSTDGMCTPIKKYRFHVPGIEQKWRWGFYSCNGFHNSVHQEGRYQGIQPLWRDVGYCHEQHPMHVMVGGGDQLYNDDVWNLPSLVQWIQLPDKGERLMHPFTQEMIDQVFWFYLTQYLKQWSQPLFADALASIPQLMTWDDHEIFDGWGSYPPEIQYCAVWQGIFTAARKFYCLFQHHATPDRLVADQQIFGEVGWNWLGCLGSTTAVLMLDTRSERSRGQIITPSTWAMVKESVALLPPTVQHLVVVTAVPLIYPQVNVSRASTEYMTVDLLLQKSGLSGSLHNQFGEAQDYRTEHWSSEIHAAERLHLVHLMQECALMGSLRISFMAGDVHVAGVAKLLTQPKANLRTDHRYMLQVISSAIGNAPPPAAVVKALENSAKARMVDADTCSTMINLFGTNKCLKASRNWCLVTECQYGGTPGSDGSLQFQLRVEKEDLIGQRPETFTIVAPALQLSQEKRRIQRIKPLSPSMVDPPKLWDFAAVPPPKGSTLAGLYPRPASPDPMYPADPPGWDSPHPLDPTLFPDGCITIPSAPPLQRELGTGSLGGRRASDESLSRLDWAPQTRASGGDMRRRSGSFGELQPPGRVHRRSVSFEGVDPPGSVRRRSDSFGGERGEGRSTGAFGAAGQMESMLRSSGSIGGGKREPQQGGWGGSGSIGGMRLGHQQALGVSREEPRWNPGISGAAYERTRAPPGSPQWLLQQSDTPNGFELSRAQIKERLWQRTQQQQQQRQQQQVYGSFPGFQEHFEGDVLQPTQSLLPEQTYHLNTRVANIALGATSSCRGNIPSSQVRGRGRDSGSNNSYADHPYSLNRVLSTPSNFVDAKLDARLAGSSVRALDSNTHGFGAGSRQASQAKYIHSRAQDLDGEYISPVANAASVFPKEPRGQLSQAQRDLGFKSSSPENHQVFSFYPQSHGRR
eukprot:gene7892-1102_t